MIRTISTSRRLRLAVHRDLATRGGRRHLAAFGAALFVLSGCGGDSGDPGDLAVAGGRLLYEQNCLTCHGEGALGDGPLARTLPVPTPALKEHLGHHTQAQLIQLIKGGVPPAMPPTTASEEEIQLIVDYLWTLVPESEVAALREMQHHMEMMGDPAMGNMPSVDGASGTGDGSGSDSDAHAGHSM